VHDGLGDLRADAADDAVSAHEAGRGDGLEQVLGDQGVDGRHAGDVDDGHAGAGLHDALQQRLHDDLRAGAVEGADERKSQHAIQSFTTGVDSSSMSCCWRAMISSRDFW